MALANNTQGAAAYLQQVPGEMEFDAMIGLQTTLEPYVQILEEPRARGLRFRYECEGRAAGSIPGESSTPENRTYPKIQINNSNASDAIVVVSTVTKDNPPRPHPHSLVGKDCKKGVCTVKLKKQSLATFPNLGIQCAKKKSVLNALEERKQLRVDPFQTGFDFEASSYDLSVVRLCFQVFLPDPSGKFTRIVRPVVSQCIYDRKTVTDLVICRISRQAGSVQGGEDVFLLCDKVNKDDIEVRFYEEDKDGVSWEARGDFGQPDVHRQFAIVFRTPAYRDLNISQPVAVMMQLKRPSDGETSDPLQFTYAPIDPDPYGISRKRFKSLHIPDCVSVPETNNVAAEGAKTKETIKNRLLAKPRRGRGAAAAATIVKQENSPEAPACNQVNANQQMVMNNVDMTNLDPTQMGAMMNAGPPKTEPELGSTNPAPFEWQMGLQHYIVDGNVGQGQQVVLQANGENNAQSILTELADGGVSTSLTIDSNSLLQYLQDDSENSSLLLNQFLQNQDADMQS